jgi:predicted Zn-dependent peptidase
VLPEYQDRAVELLADVLRPSLRDDDFETEKLVIVEEIRKYEDQPPFGAHEKCMAAYFGTHPLGYNVLGTIESVSGLTPAAMREYFQQRYAPSNIVLAAAGRVDFDQLVASADRYCGPWQPLEARRAATPAEPHTAFQVIPKQSAMQQYVVQIASGPAANDEDRYANRVLATILGDDSGSRMYWELIETGLAEYAGLGVYEFDAAGITMTYLCCAPEQTADNLQTILDLQRRAMRDGVSPSELELARSKICSHVVLQSERPTNRLFGIGNDWIQRRSYRTVKEKLKKYQAVDIDQVAAILDRYPLTVNATVAVGPLHTLAAPQ